jgi:hypothetical protein
MFHGLRTFGPHGSSHGDRHGRLYPVEGPYTPHHGQKTLFGALTCSSWGWLTERPSRSLVEREIGDPGCADIRCHSQSLRSPASALCAGEAHPATLLVAKVPCARHFGARGQTPARQTERLTDSLACCDCCSGATTRSGGDLSCDSSVRRRRLLDRGTLGCGSAAA